jgi:hypothetical protein
MANGGGRCVCPQGTAETGGACQKCASGATWSSDAAGEHCTTPPGAFPCGQGQIRDATGTCKTDCGPAAINDPANTAKCLKCGKGKLAFGGKCVDTKIDKTPEPNGQLTPVIPAGGFCPAGTRINAAGNACEKDPAAACAKMGPNYVISATSRDGCKKCPLGKVSNLSRTGCIVGLGRLQTSPGDVEPPHINVPATRAPMPAPHPNTSGGKP